MSDDRRIQLEIWKKERDARNAAAASNNRSRTSTPAATQKRKFGGDVTNNKENMPNSCKGKTKTTKTPAKALTKEAVNVAVQGAMAALSAERGQGETNAGLESTAKYWIDKATELEEAGKTEEVVLVFERAHEAKAEPAEDIKNALLAFIARQKTRGNGPQSAGAAQSRPATTRPTATPRSARRLLSSGRKLTGSAQRVAVATPDKTRKFPGIDPSNIKSSTVKSLQPVRAVARIKEELGSEVVLSPVRRSGRETPSALKRKVADADLEDTNYAFQPNLAMAFTAVAEPPLKKTCKEIKEKTKAKEEERAMDAEAAVPSEENESSEMTCTQNPTQNVEMTCTQNPTQNVEMMCAEAECTKESRAGAGGEDDGEITVAELNEKICEIAAKISDLDEKIATPIKAETKEKGTPEEEEMVATQEEKETFATPAKKEKKAAPTPRSRRKRGGDDAFVTPQPLRRSTRIASAKK